MTEITAPQLPRLRHPEKAHRPDQAQPKKPDWIRVKAPVSEGYKRTRDIMQEHRLSTVCEEAGCPNVGECWSQGHATMMIMGEVCTRACTFCNIATGKPPEALDVFEPGRVADAVQKLGLNHVVVTSVDRDDVEESAIARVQRFAGAKLYAGQRCVVGGIGTLLVDGGKVHGHTTRLVLHHDAQPQLAVRVTQPALANRIAHAACARVARKNNFSLLA